MSNGIGSKIRGAAFAVAAGAALLSPNAGANAAETHPPRITPAQCTVLTDAAEAAFKQVTEVSSDFSASWNAFVGPNKDCSGPRALAAKTWEDSMAFFAVRGAALRASFNPEERGVQMASAPVNRIGLTYDQCRSIASVSQAVVKSLGPETLSVEFRKGWRDFVAPVGKLTCDGSTEIATPNGSDIDALGVIAVALKGLKPPINIFSYGVRGVPQVVGSLASSTRLAEAQPQ